MKKYFMLLVSLLSMTLVYTSCHKDNLRNKENELQLNKKDILLQMGETYQLILSRKDGATPGNVTWSSSDKTIATVSSVGLVKGVSEGEATVTAKSGESLVTCKINVVSKDNKGLESMRFEKKVYELVVNERQSIQLVFTPASWFGTIIYKSSNEKVVSVSNEGEIMGIKEGEVSITATVGDITATCKVVVTPPKEYEVKIIPNFITLSKGKTSKPEVTVNDQSYELRFPLIWESSDEECFSVDETGTITAKTFGAGVVTVSIDNGNSYNSAYAYVKVEDFSLHNEYDNNFVCSEIPFPYLEFPTTKERIAAAERNIGYDNIPFRKLIKEEDGKLYYRLRNFAGHNPAGIFFGMAVYNLSPTYGKPFAQAWAEGVSSEDRIPILQQFIEKAGFGTMTKIKIAENITGYRAVNNTTKQSLLIYMASNPLQDNNVQMGVLEFRTLDNDPYADNNTNN